MAVTSTGRRNTLILAAKRWSVESGANKLTFQIEKAYKILVILGHYTFPRHKGLLSQMSVMIGRYQMPI